MKAPIKIIALVIIALISSQTHAQVSMVSGRQYKAKQKINVDFQVTPSVPGFRAGVSLIDSVQNKFRLWINNREEKKFTISISGVAGHLWSREYKDAYFNQVFDLSTLDDGEYLIKVNCGPDIFEKKIVLSTNSYVNRELKME